MNAPRVSTALPWSGRATIAAVAVLLVLGIVCRCLGYFDGSMSLWMDEEIWGNLVARKQFKQVIRPIGYMVLNWALIQIHNNEIVLRSVSFAAGIAGVFAYWRFSRRAFRSPVTVILGLFVVAFEPRLITLAKEFKQYALEYTVHVALATGLLAYLQSRRTVYLWTTLVGAAICPLFTTSPIFLFPSLFGLLLLHAYQHKDKKLAIVTAAVATAILAELVTMYVTLWTRNSSGSSSFWGRKYKVFFREGSERDGSGLLDHALWTARKFFGLVEQAMDLKVFWGDSPDTKPLGFLLLGLVLIGVASLVRKRATSLLAITFGPLAVAVLFNWLGYWPFGPFRSNAWMLFYVLVAILHGWDSVLTSIRAPLRYVAMAGALTYAVVHLPFRLDYFQWKHRGTFAWATSVQPMLEVVYQAERTSKRRVPLLMDTHACIPLRYYWTKHSVYKKRYRRFYRRKLRPMCHRAPQKLLGRLRGKTAWLMLAGKTTGAVRKRLRRMNATILYDQEHSERNYLLKVKIPRKRRKKKTSS